MRNGEKERLRQCGKNSAGGTQFHIFHWRWDNFWTT